MNMIWNNLSYALRRLRKSAGFTLTVMLTLALGVGANVVVFSVLNALILQPLPLPDADQLWFFNRVFSTTGSNLLSSPSESYPDYRDMRDRNHSFTGITAYRVVPVGVKTGDAVAKSWIYEASGNYFDLLGVQPALGRFFHASDEHGVDGSPYTVLAYNYWREHFHADPGVIDRIVEINKHPFTVLGVAPASFTGTELFMAPDLWTPILNAHQLESYTSFERRDNHGLQWIGRLKPGVTLAQAEADVNGVAAQMSRQNKEDDGLRFHLSCPGLIGDYFGGPVREFLLGVMVLAGLVLIAACANLGSLFAARAADRSRELAVRLALGATHAALVRQLLAESLVVSLAGGAAGVLAALSMLEALSLWRPSSDFPAQLVVQPDVRVFLFALGLSLASGLFLGLVPLRQIRQEDAYSLIKTGSNAGSGRKWTLRDLLLVTQITLCSILVTASLVAVRGLGRALDTRYGFEPQGALLASFDLKMAGYTDDSALALQHHAVDAVQALPGVVDAGFTNTVPLAVGSSDSSVYPDGTTDFRVSNAVAEATYYDVSPSYLGAAKTKLLAGRDFTWHDDAKAPHVAIVNESFAHRVFGTRQGLGAGGRGNSADAIGRYFMSSGRWQVIGVVEDGKYTSLTEDAAAAMFFPVAQQTNASTVMIVRGRVGDDPALASQVRRALLSVDPNMPVSLSGWSEAMGMALFPSVAATAALGVMGALAAMLAVTGIFGMASYSVSKRLRELGLRVALGAQRKEVLAAALGRPARLLVFGSLAGLVLGAAASRLLAHVVYGASPQDPAVLAGVVASMALLALGATWLPARRALRVDPARLLREE
jgi:predicted permease